MSRLVQLYRSSDLSVARYEGPSLSLRAEGSTSYRARYALGQKLRHLDQEIRCALAAIDYHSHSGMTNGVLIEWESKWI